MLCCLLLLIPQYAARAEYSRSGVRVERTPLVFPFLTSSHHAHPATLGSTHHPNLEHYINKISHFHAYKVGGQCARVMAMIVHVCLFLVMQGFVGTVCLDDGAGMQHNALQGKQLISGGR